MTVLSANGFTAAAGNIAPGTANGWTCAVFRNVVTCTRSDVLAPGKTYPAITLSVLVESAFPVPPELNLLSTVSGGGMLGQNQAFDVIVAFPGNLLPGTATRLTVHTVPEGLGMNVDGVLNPTPHSFFYRLDTVHTFLEPFPATFIFSAGLLANSPTCLTGVSVTCTFDASTVPPYLGLVIQPNADVNSSSGTRIYTYVVAIPL